MKPPRYILHPRYHHRTVGRRRYSTLEAAKQAYARIKKRKDNGQSSPTNSLTS